MARLLAFAALLLLASCGLPGNVVVLLPDENGAVGKVTVQQAGGTATLDQPLEAVETKPGEKPGAPFQAKQDQVSESFAGALAGTPRQPQDFILYFVTGRTDLTQASRTDLDAAIAAAKSTPNIDVSVTGHADATGAEAENVKLSLRRAEIVRDALVKAGVPADVIELAYHGSNNPRVPQRQGVSEPRNRRVEITIR
ncbi:MAG TPA: OmpA family protein [Aliidongia sp.]|nr:OmpA family protein [Aliidongia sp.]